MKKDRGMSLLEIIVAITLLAVAVPSFFGIFFANADVSKKLSIRMNIKETADDARSFVKLSGYDNICNLAKNSELLAVEEVEEDGIALRKFVGYGSNDNRSPCDFVTKLEFINRDSKMLPAHTAQETCAIPLRCKIYHIKSKKQNIPADQLLRACDMEYDLVVVKNR